MGGGAAFGGDVTVARVPSRAGVGAAAVLAAIAGADSTRCSAATSMPSMLILAASCSGGKPMRSRRWYLPYAPASLQKGDAGGNKPEVEALNPELPESDNIAAPLEPLIAPGLGATGRAVRFPALVPVDAAAAA